MRSTGPDRELAHATYCTHEPPRGVVEKAAALAALHSKARNASLVAVVWTEKRYVRKPRKSPPGLAVTLRDQTVMVTPGIASGVEPA